MFDTDLKAVDSIFLKVVKTWKLFLFLLFCLHKNDRNNLLCTIYELEGEQKKIQKVENFTTNPLKTYHTTLKIVGFNINKTSTKNRKLDSTYKKIHKQSSLEVCDVPTLYTVRAPL